MAESSEQAAPVETELKLQIRAEDVELLKQQPLLTGAPASHVEIDNIYFDTPDQLLRRHRLALRLRRIDGRWLQTLKSDSNGGGALSSRGEWETPAKPALNGGAARLDLVRLRGTPLPKLLAGRKPKPALRPVFHTRVQRTQWTVELNEAAVEVALDVGEIRNQTATEPISEVELELKRGGPAALLDAAQQLVNAESPTPMALFPLARSKAARGYQLGTRGDPLAVKASAKGFAGKLTRKTSTARALRAIVAHGLSVLTANAELLMCYSSAKCSAEYVHQARVSLRRMRSAIRLFDPDQRDVPQAWSDELHWLARALGAARDADVMANATLVRWSKAQANIQLAAVVVKAEQRRRQQRAKIRTALRSARYTSLILSGERWCLTPSPGDAELLSSIAAPKLQRAARKLFKAGRFFAALSPEDRHQVRILAKRLRYALDLFAVSLPKQSTTRIIDALADLQDVLGELNDDAVALATLPKLAKSARFRKAVRHWLVTTEADRLRDVERRLLALSQLPAPWK